MKGHPIAIIDLVQKKKFRSPCNTRPAMGKRSTFDFNFSELPGPKRPEIRCKLSRLRSGNIVDDLSAFFATIRQRSSNVSAISLPS